MPVSNAGTLEKGRKSLMSSAVASSKTLKPKDVQRSLLIFMINKNEINS